MSLKNERCCSAQKHLAIEQKLKAVYLKHFDIWLDYERQVWHDYNLASQKHSATADKLTMIWDVVIFTVPLGTLLYARRKGSEE